MITDYPQEYPETYLEFLFGGVLLWEFVNCWTSNLKRKKFVKYGMKFDGYIIGAEWSLNGRGTDFYYLLISFYEDGLRKIRYTERYVGSPNYRLKDARCEIYKWKGKYIEANFHGLDKKQKPIPLSIPITRYPKLKKKKGYV